MLNKVQDNLSVLSVELLPLHERLVTVRRKLVASGLATKVGSLKVALKPMQEELCKIDSLSTSRFWLKVCSSHALFLPLSQLPTPRHYSHSETTCNRKRVDGKFPGPNGSIPASQAIFSSLLEEWLDAIQEICAQEESKHVALPLIVPIYDRLAMIRAQLEDSALTHRWTLRKTYLWNYLLSLHVERMQIDENFDDSEGAQPLGQYVRLIVTRFGTLEY